MTFFTKVFLLVIYQVLIVHSLYKDIDSTLCSGLCTCEEETKYEIPMWVIDCSMRDYKNIFLNVSIPEESASLDYSRNSIKSIGKSKNFSSKGLRKLDLSRNNIVIGMGMVFTDFPNLLYLDLSYNKLSLIDSELFFGLNKLIYLDLSFNYITKLPTAVFISLPILNTVSLSSNPIGPFLSQVEIFSTVGLSLTTNIRVLKLNNINMTVDPSMFLKDAHMLQQLYISENPLNSINISSVPKTVQILDISGSNISKLDPIFHVNLEILLMNRMKRLSSLNDYVFSNLSSIKEISIDYSRSMTNISGLIFGLETNSKNYSLKKFSVSGCSLNTLNENLKNSLMELDFLDLSFNPWNCDCQLKWISWAKNLKRVEYFQCQTPINLKNKQVLHVYEKQCDQRLDHPKLNFVYILLLTTLMLFILLLGVTVYTKLNSRGQIEKIIVSPSSPYSPITIDPNSADY